MKSLQRFLGGSVLLWFLHSIYISWKFEKGGEEERRISIVAHYNDIQKESRIFNVLDFGALGDGSTDDAVALRRALHKAASIQQSHTTVWLPTNHVFCSGPLNLLSHLTLQIDGTLKALFPNETFWPQIAPLPTYGNSRDGPTIVTEKTGRYKHYYPLQCQAFLYASHAHHIHIVGSGVVDGQGSYWWNLYQKNDTLLEAGRPNLVQIVHGQHVEIAGITFRDSPFWCIHPALCEHVHIHHIQIQSPLHAPNSDGIHPDLCRHIMIQHNNVSCGDDNVAIKAGVCEYSSPIDCHNGFTDGR